jgi:hypothetical protein
MKTLRCFLIGLATFTFSARAIAADTNLNLQIERAVKVSFMTETGKVYRLQTSPSIGPSLWTTYTTIEGNGLRYDAGFLTGSNVHSFFRVRETGPTNGLVLHYPFDGNANDESGFGNHGIVTGAILGTNRFGETNNSYVFTASGDYPLWIGDTVSTSSTNGFPSGTSDVSISLWVSLSLFGPDYHVLVANGEVNQFQLGIGLFTANNAPIEFYSGFGLIAPSLQSGSLDWTLGRWYNIQLTRAANVVTIYRDGIELAQGTVTSGNGAAPENRILDFGYRTQPANHPLWGQLDDIRMYDRALTTNEIQSLLSLQE